jgi:hypothetical protein
MRREIFPRQRLERQHHGLPTRLGGQCAGACNQGAVSEMDAIEAAHRHGDAAMSSLEALQSAYEFHDDYAPLLRM